MHATVRGLSPVLEARMHATVRGLSATVRGLSQLSDAWVLYMQLSEALVSCRRPECYHQRPESTVGGLNATVRGMGQLSEVWAYASNRCMGQLSETWLWPQRPFWPVWGHLRRPRWTELIVSLYTSGCMYCQMARKAYTSSLTLTSSSMSWSSSRSSRILLRVWMVSSSRGILATCPPSLPASTGLRICSVGSTIDI